MKKRITLVLCISAAVITGSYVGYTAGCLQGASVATSVMSANYEAEQEFVDCLASLHNTIIKDKEVELTAAKQQVSTLKKFVGNYNVAEFKVTAYSPYDNVSGMENNGEGSITSTGSVPKNGTIAVDPKVIPYGADIIILYDNGEIIRGKAEDCGGAIKGHKLDVFKWTYKETTKHGIRNATVLWSANK